MWACFLSVTFQISKNNRNSQSAFIVLVYIDAHFSLLFHPHKIKNTRFQNSSITLTVQVIILPLPLILQYCKKINAQIFLTMGFLNCISTFVPS